MRIPKRTIHLLIGFEILLVMVVVLTAVLKPEEEPAGFKENTQTPISSEAPSQTTEQQETQEVENIPVDEEAITFAQEIQDKVAAMTLEQKVAQIFVTTPEQLTDMVQVTKTGDTTRNAIRAIPVGGLVYSSLNFEGKIQTASMIEELQEYYIGEFGIPLFTMVAESGGTQNSPLAMANGFEPAMSAAETGEIGDVAQAEERAKHIATYMKNQGLNTNIGILADMPGETDADYDRSTFSASIEVAESMVSATVKGYQDFGIITAMSMLPGESYGVAMLKTLEEWQSSDEMVYRAGISAGVDMIIVSNGYASAITGDEAEVPCCMSSNMVQYIRRSMQYQGMRWPCQRRIWQWHH